MSFLLIQKLHDCGLIRELWPYLDVKDISRILTTDKNIRGISLRMNEVISQRIYLVLNHKSEKEKENILDNMISSFPNISKLSFELAGYDDRSRKRISYDSLKKLYNCISVCKSLRELTVSILGEGVTKGISNLKNIQTLNIQFSLISSDDMYEIGSMVNITSLNCGNCEDIENEGLNHILKLVKLKTLIINNIGITDVGLFHLSCLTNLTDLNISECSEITHLSFISSITSITSLDLSNCNNLTDFGISHLSSLTNMTSLDMSNCYEITNLSPLSSMIGMKTLNLSDCRNLNDFGFSHILQLTNMASLDISNCHKITTLFFTSRMISLISLNLYDCEKLTDEGLSHLSLLNTLTALNLSHCFRHVMNFSFLSLMKTIETLNLYECYALTDEGMLSISSLINITDLNLHCCWQITNYGLSCLKNLKKIKSLDIIGCNNIVDNDGLYSISLLTNIQKLEMSIRYGMTNEGFIYLCKLENLNEINISTMYYSIKSPPFYDINLSQTVIDKFVNMKIFQIPDIPSDIISVKGVNMGFYHIVKLRKEREDRKVTRVSRNSSLLERLCVLN